MGGRRSYSARRLTGDTKKVKSALSSLRDFISSEEPKKAAEAATKVISSSPKAISVSAYSLRLASAISQNRERWQSNPDDEQVRREIAEKWTEAKQKHKIHVDKEIDRVVVESALKFIRGGKQ